MKRVARPALRAVIRCVAWAAMAQACAQGVGAPGPVRPEEPPSSTYREVSDEPGDHGGGELSLREALAGTVEDEGVGGALGSRMQIRPLRLPQPARGATARFNFDRGRRGWVTAMPRSELLTSPAFDRGRVFLGGGFASHRFYAFDAYSGELDWSVAAPDGGPTAAIVEDGKVVFNTESCTIFAAQADTGEVLWSRWLGDPLMSQPAAADGRVFSAYPKNGAHEFGAFDLADGEPIWATSIAADVIQAPQVSDGSVYFATMDGTAYRLDAQTGRVVWRRDVGASSAVWVDREHVLVARRVDGEGPPREQMVTLRVGDGRLAHEGSSFAAPYLAGESRDRALATGTAGAWGSVPHGEHLGLRNVASGWAFQGSSPAVADGRAYFAMSGAIVARDMGTAETVWQRSYAEADGAQALSPPAVVGSLLVFGTVDGHLVATDIDTGMTVWAYDVGEPVVFQPIVAQGWVYLATGRGKLIGLELGDAMLDGWHMWGGNAQHAGLVETSGTIDPALLASLERPSRGSMRTVASARAPSPEESPPEGSAHVLASDDDRDLPLRGTEVEARVSGRVAEVHVTQRFVNDHDYPIEAVYLFPLPEDAAVDQMSMQVGGRSIEGVIRGRGEARRTYEAARSQGRRAALLEQQRPNLFAQRVANIPPGEAIDVRLRYVQTLPFSDGEYAFDFPMVAPRRHRPAEAVAAPSSTDGAVEAVSGRIDELPPLRLALELDAGVPLLALRSSSHPGADIQRSDGGRARVALEAMGEGRGRDFGLRYRVGGANPTAAVLAHREEGEEAGFFSLLIQPPTAPAEGTVTPRDVTFVIDTSSSMHGRPLAQATATVRAVIQQLRAQDRFNVIGFSDRVRTLAERPRVREAGSVEEASTFVSGLRASGATEMVPAIDRALADPVEDGRLAIVVLLTDGYIGNEAEVLRHVAMGLGERRIYALGVGSSVNRFLVERVAEIGRGRALAPALTESPEAVAGSFAELIDRPVFTDIAIDWGGLSVSELYPRRLPDLFAGQPVVLYGRFEGSGTRTVRVRGTVGGRRYERRLEVGLPAGATTPSRHASQASLWARAAVRDRMNRLTLRDDQALIDEVRQLGIAHHLVTPWTSFVAVERDEREEEAEPEVATRATVSPARALPGDPEIRIPAPADARAVTVVLPFGESLQAAWEAELSVWTARFLIPRDAEEGTYPIELLITHADGRLEHSRLWYTVDATAPVIEVTVEGAVAPGAEIVLRAEQTITEADLAQVGRAPGELSAERATLLSDARRVEARTPTGDVLRFERAGPTAWRARWTIPDDAAGEVSLDVVVVDMAANVRRQRLRLEVE